MHPVQRKGKPQLPSTEQFLNVELPHALLLELCKVLVSMFDCPCVPEGLGEDVAHLRLKSRQQPAWNLNSGQRIRGLTETTCLLGWKNVISLMLPWEFQENREVRRGLEKNGEAAF